MPSRTSIAVREFRCAEPGCVGYIRSTKIRVTSSRDYSANHGSATFVLEGATCALSALRCSNCHGPMRHYNPRGAGVGAGQRTIAWVSPDGTRVANLDEPNGIGPQGRMYAASGWERVECDTIQKLDRVSAIRTAQKTAEAGHEVISRFDVADYDSATLEAERESLVAVEAGEHEGDFITQTGVPDIIPTSQ